MTIYGVLLDYHIQKYELYSTTVQAEWKYTQKRLYKGDTIEDSRQIYIHLYYNIDKAAEDEKKFDKNLIALRNELEFGKKVPEHEKQYAKYFITKTTPKRGTQVTVKEDAVKKAKRY